MILISSIIISIPLWLIAYTLKEISIIKMRIDDINEEADEMIKQNEQNTLYTEEQIKEAMYKARGMQYVTYSDDEIIESLKKVIN